MDESLIIGNRRFRCLSPTLVRIEYSPGGTFEDRRSIVACSEQTPLAFKDVREDGDWTVLDTGLMEVMSRENELKCDRTNLEIRWTDGRVMQCWRPGDRDHQNLGGTLRSLDRYGNGADDLDGVDEAGMEPPDPRSTVWPAWLQCEERPLYEDKHPDPPDNFNRGNWLRQAGSDHNDGRLMHRFFNRYKEARRFCPGVLSRSGYFFLNDSGSAVLDDDDFPVERRRPGCQDWYFFAYADDFKQGLKDFRMLAGPAPLPPHRSLGVMFSRWPAFTEDEIKQLYEGFRDNGYPLSVLIMDMEWHKFGWGHWDFDPEIIPDPETFFENCHQMDLDVFFNDHPLDVRSDDSHYEKYLEKAGTEDKVHEISYGDHREEKTTLPAVPVDITDQAENKAFLEICHSPILQKGLDYWWNDGTRGKMSQTCGQLVGNKSFYEETENEEQRGMLLARYGGLGSHRYGGFFTGDTASCYDVLQLQCEFNIRAGHVGLNYVSHDIGGFMTGGGETDRIDPHRYTRWLQFGIFNSIIRFHCAPNAGSRRPWDYDDDCDGACRRWLRVRHSLLPYLNTANHICFETGIPVIRGMFLEEPDNEDAYRFDQFYFGPDMLVAPVLTEGNRRSIYLPEGRWWEFETSRLQHGDQIVTRDVPITEVPVYVPAGSIIPRQNPDADIHAPHKEPLHLDVYGGDDGRAELREDDGRTPAYKEGEFCSTAFELEDKDNELLLKMLPVEGRPYGKSRDLHVDFHLNFRPTRFECDNRSVKAETSAGIYNLTIPSVRTDEGCNLRVYR
ncbi:MAG: TIM-barrel domain-containing protein [Candidatus Brocadiia bacterium]